MTTVKLVRLVEHIVWDP